MSAHEDRLALRELVDAYALAADRRDGMGAAALFTADGSLELWMDPHSDDRTAERRSHDEIARAIDGLSQYSATQHTVSATRFVVDGDTAAGETTCVAHHVERKPVQDRVLYIRYADTFVRSGAGWRFSRRELRVLWFSILPVDS